MIGFVIWIIGLILTFRAAIEIWNINAAVEKRLIAIVLIVLTSWLGLLFYYFYGTNQKICRCRLWCRVFKSAASQI